MILNSIQGQYKLASLSAASIKVCKSNENRQIDLPFDQTYNTRFQGAQGVRELIQNCYDGAKSSALDLNCTEIYIEKEELKQDSDQNALLFRILGNGLESPIVLGAIVLSYTSNKKCELQLFNFGVRLTPNMIMIMGRSSKSNENGGAAVDLTLFHGKQIEPWIGMHGEGGLCGIIALLREQSTVEYQTNGQLWKFSFAVDPSDATKKILHADIITSAHSSPFFNDNTLVTVSNLNAKSFNIHQYLFLWRLNCKSGSSWRLLTPGAEKTSSLISGIEIFPLHSLSDSSSSLLYNRSIMVSPESIPFHVNILDSLSNVGRDRNYIGMKRSDLFLNYLIPSFIRKPIRNKKLNPELNGDQTSLIEYLYNILDDKSKSYTAFSRSMITCYESLEVATDESRSCAKKFARLLLKHCAKSNKMNDVIPYSEANFLTERVRCRDAGLDIKKLVPVSQCLYTIFSKTGLLDEIEKSARRIQTQLFASPELDLLFSNRALSIYNDLVYHIHEFSNYSPENRIQIVVHDVSMSNIPSEVFSRLSNSALVQIRYMKEQRKLSILSSCFESERIHAIQNQIFRSDTESLSNSTRSSVRKLGCSNSSNKLCRCLLNLVLREIASKHNWSDADISRYWSFQSAPESKDELNDSDSTNMSDDDNNDNSDHSNNHNQNQQPHKMPRLNETIVIDDSDDDKQNVKRHSIQTTSCELKHKQNHHERSKLESFAVGEVQDTALVNEILSFSSNPVNANLDRAVNFQNQKQEINSETYPLEKSECDNLNLDRFVLQPNQNGRKIAFYLPVNMNSNFYTTTDLVDGLNQFSNLLETIFVNVFPEVNLQNVAIFLDENGSSAVVARNRQHILYFNLRYYMEVHKNNSQKSKFEQAFSWFDTAAHELVHNKILPHNFDFQRCKDTLVTSKAELFCRTFSHYLRM